LASSPGENYTIETILFLPNSNKSFIVGGSDGLLYLYEKADSKEAKNLYIKSDRKLSLNEFKGRITSLLSSPKEDLLFVGLNTGIILKLSLDKNEEHSC
jgi:WD40 repeat protein